MPRTMNDHTHHEQVLIKHLHRPHSSAHLAQILKRVVANAERKDQISSQCAASGLCAPPPLLHCWLSVTARSDIGFSKMTKGLWLRHQCLWSACSGRRAAANSGGGGGVWSWVLEVGSRPRWYRDGELARHGADIRRSVYIRSVHNHLYPDRNRKPST